MNKRWYCWCDAWCNCTSRGNAWCSGIKSFLSIAIIAIIKRYCLILRKPLESSGFCRLGMHSSLIFFHKAFLLAPKIGGQGVMHYKCLFIKFECESLPSGVNKSTKWCIGYCVQKRRYYMWYIYKKMEGWLIMWRIYCRNVTKVV